MGIIFGIAIGAIIYSLSKTWDELGRIDHRLRRLRWDTALDNDRIYQNIGKLNRKVDHLEREQKFKKKTRRYMRKG